MLAVLNTYAHGYVVAPVVVACKNKGMFNVLDLNHGLSFNDMVSKLGANPGSLSVAMNMLQSLGWVDKADDNYKLTEKSSVHKKIPDNIIDLLSFPMDEYVSKRQGKHRLKKWIDLSNDRWGLECNSTAMMLDGMLVIPLVLALKEKLKFDSGESAEAAFERLPVAIKYEVSLFFQNQKWVKKTDSGNGDLVFSDVGRFILDRIFITSIVASYHPMLASISTVLFGDCQSVFKRDDTGNELHIDRTLNVLGSGFQHGKYFNEMMNAILPLFDNDTYENQPRYIADMGCGDGTLLKTIYEFIQTKTARGKVLDQYPVKMIGIDYNQKALIETSKTLKDIDNIVIHGDIGDPVSVIKDLYKAGIKDTENILHVRSFLDHDRPYIAPGVESIKQDMTMSYDDCVCIDVNGDSISGRNVYFSLVEHLERWKSILGKFGFIALEVHSLEPRIIKQYFDKSESLHFDTYHRFSQQLLMSAEKFVMAAARVGLFPVVGGHKKFPKMFPFSRITLNHFEKRDYQIRPAQFDDLPLLNQLEDACWLSELRTPLETIERRISRYPEGQLTIHLNGELVGIIYSQRLDDLEKIYKSTVDDVEKLHDPNGSIIQLLAVNILPEVQQQGLGDQLLEFMLQRSSLMNGVDQILGITLCKDYVNNSGMVLEEYITKTNSQGLSIDPTLRFHQIHGAKIEKVVPGYRPKDVANCGNGVLIHYDIYTRERFDAIKYSKSVTTALVREKESIANFIVNTIRVSLGKNREHTFSMDYPLMEMGLDSADLLELQVQFSSEYGVSLEPAFFFTHTTASRIVDYFVEKFCISSQCDVVDSTSVPSVASSPDTDNDSSPSEDIAIVGVSCRLPGDINNLEQLWQLLKKGDNAISQVPINRWSWPTSIDPCGDYKGIDRGGYLRHIEEFDAKFFRISRKEAELMDPQQRILLELSWQCIEDSGYSASSFSGSDIGVFIGASGSDYNVLINKHVDDVEPHFGVGTSMAILANRISYFYNFSGPSIQIDTACSSSLVALHEAVKSIRNGECSQALVAGVNIMCNPSNSIAFYKAGMLADDGLCKVFDERANGYVRGEGGVMVFIKPLSQAIHDEDDIYAVVKGTAVNHGGQASGLTVPNPDRQAALLSDAYASAGVSLNNVGYIEAHGTGTSLGDPIEVRGIKQAFSGRESEKNLKCGLGSIKTNIGHLEAAAGLAGLLKLVVSLKHKQLPPSINFSRLNSNISFADTPFDVVDTLRPWEAPKSGGRRCCGVSSFGSGGTNAHVVLEETDYEQHSDENPKGPYLICLSAMTQAVLSRKMADLVTWLDKDNQCTGLAPIMAALTVGKDHFNHRWATIVNDHAELIVEIKNAIKLVEAHNSPVPEVGSDCASLSASDDDRHYFSRMQEIKQAYLDGEDIDWNRLYEDGPVARTRLPLYPFAREQFWIGMDNSDGDASCTNKIQHSLLNEKLACESGYRFNSSLTGDEYLFHQHVIKKQYVLPGVAHLEMVRACMDSIAENQDALSVDSGYTEVENKGIRLNNIVWLSPIISGASPLDLEIELSVNVVGTMDYKIQSHAKNDSDITIHSQGSAEYFLLGDERNIDLNAIKKTCTDRVISPQECYDIFHSMAFEHGPCYQSLQNIYVGQGHALGRLMLPDSYMNTIYDYQLHPSLMDGALQVSLLMTMGLPMSQSGELRTPLPFVMKQIEVIKTCTMKMWVFVRYADGSNSSDKIQKFDIELCDDLGNICVSIKSFSTMFWEEETSFETQDASRNAVSSAGAQTLFYSPQWLLDDKDKNHLAVFKGKRLTVLCESGKHALDRLMNNKAEVGEGLDALLVLRAGDDGDSDLVERFVTYTTELMERIKQFVRDGGGVDLLVQVVIFHDAAESVSDTQRMFFALSGLLRTANVEYPNLRGQVIKMAVDDQRVDLLLKECASLPLDTLVMYDSSHRWVRCLKPVKASVYDIPWKNNGVYLITGGARGLGLIFASEIANNIVGAKLYLTGRSEPKGEIESALTELRTLNADVKYIQMDVTSLQDMEQTISTIISDSGGLNGVIHSAGIIKDNYLVNKSVREAQDVLDPKVKGVVNLDRATQSIDLDFMAFFSSMTAAFGNMGQADYAAANAFMDEFSEYRNELLSKHKRRGITVSINWPLWANGGMHVSPEVEDRMEDRLGVVPLATDRGVEAFYHALSLRKSQMLVLQGSEQKIKEFISADGKQKDGAAKETSPAGVEAGMLPLVKRMLTKAATDVLRERAGFIKEDVEFSQYGFDSIMLTAFSNKLNKDIKLNLSPTVFFEYTTIEALTLHLIENYSDQLVDHFGYGVVTSEGKEKPQPAYVGSDFKPRPSVEASSYESTTNIGNIGTDKLQQADEAIAVVGMSGSFPMASNIDEFWNNIVEGKNCISEVPESRWDWQEYWGNPQSGPNQTWAKWGGFLDGVDQFDPLFFGIAPSEAELMDPQQRLVLTEIWRAIEDGGITPPMLTRDTTGVFVACGPNEYMNVVDLPNNNPLTLTSAFPSLIPNRISYLLDLKGPSEYCDTACSSSLLAVHRAIKSIQRGECTQAIVGSVNLLLSPDAFVGFDSMGYLSSDGASRSFQSESNGYVRSEAVGALILKPLSTAVRDGNIIHAVIKGTGVAHGGKGMSLTTPSVSGMKSAMLDAYRTADVDPRTISFIEAHGSAIPMADGLEVNALKSGLREAKRNDSLQLDGDERCYVSSLKPCIGHGELAAGMSALIKVIMAIKNNVIPGVPGFTSINELISLSGSSLQITGDNGKWEAIKTRDQKWLPRRASINSYGFGGLNVHAVLEEYKSPAHTSDYLAQSGDHITARGGQASKMFVFSAKSQEQLRHVIENMVDYLSTNNSVAPLADIAYTLQVGRMQHAERVAVIADSRAALQDALAAYIDGEPSPDGCFIGTAQKNEVIARFWQKYDGGSDVVNDLISHGEYSQLCHFWASGIDINWDLLYREERPARCSIPTYPFEKRKCWLESTKLRPVNVADQKLSSLTAIIGQPDASMTEDQLVRKYLTSSVSGLLGLGENEIDVDVALDKYGFDSIKQISLKHKLEYELDTEIPLSFFGMNDSLMKLISAISSLPSNDHIRERIISIYRDDTAEGAGRGYEAQHNSYGIEISV